MKLIKITIDADVDKNGNTISRTFDANGYKRGKLDWDTVIEDMLDTLEKSNEIKF